MWCCFLSLPSQYTGAVWELGCDNNSGPIRGGLYWPGLSWELGPPGNTWLTLPWSTVKCKPQLKQTQSSLYSRDYPILHWRKMST